MWWWDCDDCGSVQGWAATFASNNTDCKPASHQSTDITLNKLNLAVVRQVLLKFDSCIYSNLTPEGVTQKQHLKLLHSCFTTEHLVFSLFHGWTSTINIVTRSQLIPPPWHKFKLQTVVASQSQGKILAAAVSHNTSLSTLTEPLFHWELICYFWKTHSS